MLPMFALVDQPKRPRVRDYVQTVCGDCGKRRNVIFRDLIESANKQAKFTNICLCKTCFRKLESVKEEIGKSISSGLDRNNMAMVSKALWANKEYRDKKLANAAGLKNNIEFASKISLVIKNKFATDSEYVARVNASRRNMGAEFLARCQDVHDNLYDYSNTIYASVNIPFNIICPHHGVFTQLPSNHVRGHGCPVCAVERSRLSQSEFFARCESIHGKYDYSDSIYTSSLNQITYRCPEHGQVTQLAQNHLKGAGCRFCAASQTASAGERELYEYVSTLSPCHNNREILNDMEIDIVSDSKMIGIEYHGLYWHSFNRTETKEERYRHYNKFELAKQNGYSLIQIYENEWLTKRLIIQSILMAKFGFSERKLYARKCDIVSMNDSEACLFFETNHLQGHRKSQRYLGLVSGDELVAAASFTVINGRCELIRFCNALRTHVVGGLSRLIKRSGYRNIFTYVDRRYSSGAESYIASGFNLLGITSPGYCYCRGLNVYSRQMFQKYKLREMLADFDDNRTEAQNMFRNGYRRIWDAGHYKAEINL